MRHIFSYVAPLTIIPAEFYHEIIPAIPRVADLLRASDGDVREASAEVLSKLGKHGKPGLLTCPYH